MVIEAIEKIKNTEKENEEKIKSAEEEAERIIQNARIKAEEIIRQAKISAGEELKRNTEIEDKNTLNEIRRIENEYLEEGKKIERLAERNSSQAEKIVLQELHK